MTPVRISVQAEAELDVIWLYIATDNPANADRFLERLVGSLTKTLSTAPLAGRSHDEFEEGLRSFPVEGYIAFYRVRDGAIEIVHVIHGSRDLGGIFDL